VPSLILLRHGQASFGEADYDRLSARGVAQAQCVAADLARRGLRINLVLSGSLERQRATAEPIATGLGIGVEQDPRWDEYDSDDILASHSSSAIRQNRRPGGDVPWVSPDVFQDALEGALLAWLAADRSGPAAEAWPAFRDRVDAALENAQQGLGSGQTALVCTSSGVVAAVCLRLLDLPTKAFVAFNRVTVNAGMTRVLFGRRGATLLSFNEQAHLTAEGRSLVTYR
jgi:broad specificity phosphatase PhoE